MKYKFEQRWTLKNIDTNEIWQPLELYKSENHASQGRSMIVTTSKIKIIKVSVVLEEKENDSHKQK